MYLTISRVLFLIYFLMSLLIFLRQTPEQRKTIDGVPQPLWLAVILMLLPLVVALPLPDWLGVTAAAGMAISLVVLTAGRLQLMRVNSYSMGTNAATVVEKGGMFRWLEHPIYTGIILFLLFWSFWMPLTLIATALQYRALRESVKHEREYLATLGEQHRGIDSRFW
jgi:protein-S-isoprenylcysteine O-methyltransferase Ste14